ncbi:flocculation protein FLO11-like [Penaeus japonicus]|uniref:flocculation protein FLO11-like n=1 Tax=Penaeus japonicus TaxID=27405 RepID=UPI001C70DE0C|nr:flocculation protein FLO11-like [Penaeus japonicus]
MSPVSPCLSLTPSLLSSVSQLLDFSALVPSTSSFASAIDTVPSSASSFHSSASAFVPISVTPATALPAGAVSSHSTAQSPPSEGKTTTTTSPHQRLVLPVVASVPSAPLASPAPSDLSRSQTPFAASVTASPHAVHTAFTSPACAIHTAYTAHLPSHSTLNSGYASHTPSVAQSSFPYAPLGPVPSPAFAKVPPVLAFPPTPSARTFLLPAPSVAPPKAEPPADDEGGAGHSPLEGDFHARVLIARPTPRPQGVAEVFESKEVESAFPLHEARRCEIEEHFVRSFHPHYFPPGFLPSSYPLSLQGTVAFV